MKKNILILIFCALTTIVKAQQATYVLPKGAKSCGGFVVLSSAENKLSGDSTLIYGKVTDCTSKDEAYALIVFFNEKSKRVDTVYSDKNGSYKKKLHSGTYKLRAIAPKYGSIDTVFIDFNPQTSTQVDLYLSAGPALKD